jgi:hypothetical protein
VPAALVVDEQHPVAGLERPTHGALAG